jgi:hypothetical protein
VTETEEVKEGCGTGTNQEKRRDEEGIGCGGGVDDHPPETTKAENLTKRHLARPWRSMRPMVLFPPVAVYCDMINNPSFGQTCRLVPRRSQGRNDWSNLQGRNSNVPTVGADCEHLRKCMSRSESFGLESAQQQLKEQGCVMRWDKGWLAIGLAATAEYVCWAEMSVHSQTS